MIHSLAPCSDIPEILGLSLLIYIYLGFCFLALLSEKLTDEIDLDLFSVTVSSVSVLWVDFDLSNDIDLSNDLPLSDLLLMGLSFFF